MTRFSADFGVASRMGSRARHHASCCTHSWTGSGTSSRALSFAAALLLALLAWTPGLSAQTLDQAREALRVGSYDDAVSGFRDAVGDGAGVPAYQGLARALLTVGRYDDAEEAVWEGLEAGHSPDLLTTLGEVLVRQGDVDGAETAFRQAVDQGAPDRLTAEAELAKLLFRRGLKEEAMRRFDRFIDYYNEGRARTARDLVAVADAVKHLGIRDPQLFHDALRAYDEAAAADRSNLTPRIRAGELFIEKYNSNDARASFQEVLSINAQHPDALLGMARVMDFDGQPGAVEAAEKALEVNPNLVSARVFLAEVDLGLERTEEAEEHAREALAINPASLEALSVLAAAHFLAGDSTAFRRVRDRTLRINPRYAGLFYKIADLSVSHRKYEEAVELSRRALELDDESWLSLGLLGINQLRIGEIRQGTENLEAAFAGDPFNVWFKNTLDLLDTFERYREVETEHFVIVLDSREAELLAPYFRETAEAAFDALSRRYGYEPPTPIRVEVFPNHADFSVRTVGLTGMGALGVSFGKVLAMDSPAARERGQFNWASTLWHEVAHSFHMGLSNHEVPRWFTEGLSVHEQRTARENWGHQPTPGYLLAYREGRMPEVSRMNEGFVRPDFPEQVPFSYYQASLVCEWIEENHGFQALVDILHGYGRGLTTDEVLEDILGMSMSRVDREFDAWLKSRFDGPMKALKLPGTDESGTPLLLTERERPSVETLVQTARQQPGDFSAQLAAGQALFHEDRPDDAIPFLERAKELFPQYGAPNSPYVYLARIHRDGGELELAAAELERQLSLNESDYAAHTAQAEILEELGDTAGAIGVLEQVMEIYPYEMEIHVRLAELAEGVERWDVATRERGAVVALEPVDMADALYRLALAHYRAGDLRGARRHVLRALERAPSFREAQDLLLELRSGTEGAP